MRHKSEFQVRYKTLRKMAADMVRFSTSNDQPILFWYYGYIVMISIIYIVRNLIGSHIALTYHHNSQ